MRLLFCEFADTIDVYNRPSVQLPIPSPVASGFLFSCKQTRPGSRETPTHTQENSFWPATQPVANHSKNCNHNQLLSKLQSVWSSVVLLTQRPSLQPQAIVPVPVKAQLLAWLSYQVEHKLDHFIHTLYTSGSDNYVVPLVAIRALYTSGSDN